MIPTWKWQGTRTGHAALVLIVLCATVSLVCPARPEDALIRVGGVPLDDSGQPVRIRLTYTQLPALYQTQVLLDTWGQCEYGLACTRGIKLAW